MSADHSDPSPFLNPKPPIENTSVPVRHVSLDHIKEAEAYVQGFETPLPAACS